MGRARFSENRQPANSSVPAIFDRPSPYRRVAMARPFKTTLLHPKTVYDECAAALPPSKEAVAKTNRLFSEYGFISAGKSAFLPPRRSVPSQERPGTKPATVRFPLPHPLPAERAVRNCNRWTPHFVSPHGRDSDPKPQGRTPRHHPHSRKCKPPRKCGPSGEPATPVAGILRCAHGFGKRAPSETSPRLRPKNRTMPVPTGIIVFPRTPTAGRPRHSFRPFPTAACDV